MEHLHKCVRHINSGEAKHPMINSTDQFISNVNNINSGHAHNPMVRPIPGERK